MTGTRAEQAAASFLRMLLERPRYRRVWQRYATRRTDTLNQSAISHAIAQHLWDHSIRPEAELDLPRRLKDRVGRALSGHVLSAETVEWFIEAFGFLEADARDLRSLCFGHPFKRRVVTGDLRIPDLLPSQHRTVSLHEVHVVGAGGRAVSHRVEHVIEALVDGTAVYPFYFDSDQVTVEVTRGGKAGPVRPDASGLHAVDIALNRPLQRGETASLGYVSTFTGNHSGSPEFRRAATRRMHNVALHLQFDPSSRPRHLHWCLWDSLTDDPSWEEPVELDDDGATHRFLQAAESVVVGFRWAMS